MRICQLWSRRLRRCSRRGSSCGGLVSGGGWLESTFAICYMILKSQILPLLHCLPRRAGINPQSCRANMQMKDRPGQIKSLILAKALKAFAKIVSSCSRLARQRERCAARHQGALDPTALTHSHAPAFDSATNRRPLASYRGEEHGIFICSYIYVCIYLSIYLSIYLHIDIYMFIYIYICITRCR